MRRILLACLALVFGCLSFSVGERNLAAVSAEQDKISVIIEVKGDPERQAARLKHANPRLEVLAVYKKLFNGLALKGTPRQFTQLRSLDFVQTLHPVQTYSALPVKSGSPVKDLKAASKKTDAYVFPNALNDTPYTGKGVKVGVVDTGIDYRHPDLRKNYKGGFDAVDLDRDPLETQPEEGAPTLHGSHVAGIIAADGNLKGVAPNADLYAYRALGPGGSGTSVQVIAAMEEAVNDGMDVINLSLGNTVNGPDYPTSLAVNRAESLGVAVVVANGNDGPGLWTVGSPATALKAFAIGARSHPHKQFFLEDVLGRQKLAMLPMAGSQPWTLEGGAYLADGDDPESDLAGAIALIKREKKVPFSEKVYQAQQRGAAAVLIYNNERGSFQGSVAESREPLDIPAAGIAQETGRKLVSKLKRKGRLYLNARQAEQEAGIAGFSSRGPVAVNWAIKPDLVAPGTNIVSTVPGGYEALQGTSMAAPHAAGVFALVKEARPKWTNEQIIGALKTTAGRMENDGKPYSGIMQGMGEIRPAAAIAAKAIINEPLLAFGKTAGTIDKKTAVFSIENMTDQPQRYRFQVPPKVNGAIWQLPQSFVLQPKEKRKIEIKLDLHAGELKKGIHQGWIALTRDGEETYQLPYMFISKTSGEPKAMGLEFSLKPFSKDTYGYQLYFSDEVEFAEVHLYSPDTLVHEQVLLKLRKPKTGMNEGELTSRNIPLPGQYIALVTVQLMDGTLKSYESWVYIE